MAKFIVESIINQEKTTIEAETAEYTDGRVIFKDTEGSIVGMFMNVNFHKATETE